jgi:hypothetical protein
MKEHNKTLYLGLNKTRAEIVGELVLPAILMSLLGGYYWAIRGSPGGGAQFPGLGWGLAWYYLSYEKQEHKRRVYSAGWVVLAIAVGVRMGGNIGYGSYISWIKHMFHLEYQGTWIPVVAWPGYVYLFFCGLQWGGIPGVLISWCGSKKPLKAKDWVVRFAFGISGALIAYGLVSSFPRLFYPLYSEGYYADPVAYPQCQNVIRITHEVVIAVGLFLGFWAYEIVRKDWRNVLLSMTLALGFAIPFVGSAFWHLMYLHSELALDWWKNWEMSIGLGGGVAFGLCYYLYNRPIEADKQALVRVRPYSVHRNAERLIGVYFPLWLFLNVSVMTTVEGISENFGFDMSPVWYIVPGIVFYVPSTAVYLWLIYGTMKNPFKRDDGRPNVTGVPKLFVATQLFLIALGYAVSVRRDMNLALWVLLAVYTVFLVLGVVTFLAIKRTRETVSEQTTGDIVR